MTLQITLTITAAAALINIWLMIRCGQARRSAKVSIGDGGNDLLIRRMRAHANFIENTPIVLILVGALEATGGSSTWLWIIGIVYTLGRLLHPLGMDREGENIFRGAGTGISMLSMLGLAVMAFVSVYSKLI